MHRYTQHTQRHAFVRNGNLLVPNQMRREMATAHTLRRAVGVDLNEAFSTTKWRNDLIRNPLLLNCCASHVGNDVGKSQQINPFTCFSIRSFCRTILNYAFVCKSELSVVIDNEKSVEYESFLSHSPRSIVYGTSFALLRHTIRTRHTAVSLYVVSLPATDRFVVVTWYWAKCLFFNYSASNPVCTFAWTCVPLSFVCVLVWPCALHVSDATDRS